MCKKKQPPPKHSNVGFLSNLRMNQLFPLDISGRVWGQKPTGWTWAHRTETEIRTKAHRLIFFLLSLLCRHYYLLHLGILLIISSHTSIRVRISVVSNTTQDSSVCLSVSYLAPHEMAEFASCYSTTVFESLYQPRLHITWQCLPLGHTHCQVLIVIVQYNSICFSVSTSPSHKMAVFASFSHAEHHTRW